MRYFIYCRKSSEAEDRQALSIESQLTTLQRTFGDRSDIEIAQIFEEAYSAKAPGRERFNEMLARIERGEASGIVAWAPDRLARNSVDGGRIVYLLDRGVLKDLKFATYSFENNSQGKFMLQIMFGQSKYYSDALSENVKRGNRTKLERGWRPNHAPLGYRNDPISKTIVKDPVHFPLIRRMYELVLTGTYTVKGIATIARNDWGFLTPKRKRSGRTPLATSTVYRIFTNPFYAGVIVWGGQTYPGKHEPVVSIDDFRRVRRLLEGRGYPRPQRYSFALTGIIRCGSCGLFVTAERKVNRYGSRYIYYHCSRSRPVERCNEPSVEIRDLELQIETYLRSLAIVPEIEKWILSQIKHDAQTVQDQKHAQAQSLQATLISVDRQLTELTGLRLRELLTDGEFVAQRQQLQQERLRLTSALNDRRTMKTSFEPSTELISFGNRAAEWFLQGDDQTKRLILKSVSSNLMLTGKILNIEAAKPFLELSKFATYSRRLGVVGNVRTCPAGTKRKLDKTLKDFLTAVQDPKTADILDNIRAIREKMEAPNLLLDAARSARVVRGRGKARRDAGPSPSPRQSKAPSRTPPCTCGSTLPPVRH